jgi:WD40 repeat protein
VKISPKGFYFASGGADSMIFLWSTNKNAPLASYSEHTEDVTHVDFTDNLNYIVSASLDKTFRIWNIENGDLVRILFFDYPVTA